MALIGGLQNWSLNIVLQILRGWLGTTPLHYGRAPAPADLGLPVTHSRDEINDCPAAICVGGIPHKR